MRQSPEPGRLGDRRDAGRGHRPVPPRPLLPHGVGVDLRHAGARHGGGGGARSSGAMTEWRPPFGAMSAANWIGINAEPVPAPLRRDPRACSAGSPSTGGPTRPQPRRHLPRPDDHGRLPGARLITSPFGLYDCDVPCDASIAVIVSDASSPATWPRPAIRIDAVGTQITERVSWDQDTVTHEPQVLGQSAHLWSRTEPAPRATSTWRCSTTASASTPSRGSRRSASAGSARPRTGSTAAAASRSTASSPVEPARRPALRGPHPRVRVPLRGDHPAPPRRRRAPGPPDARTRRGPRAAAAPRPASSSCSATASDGCAGPIRG